MESLFKDIPRLGVTKTKPKIGEIRLTTDGTRRKIFDGNCWQYLCTGDPKCLVQSKSTCRHHRIPIVVVPVARQRVSKKLLEKAKVIRKARPKIGEMQTMPSGNRRLWKGERWHGLCRVENCPVQAREYCKAHLNTRMSLPNTNVTLVPKAGSGLRTRSLTINSAPDQEHDETEESSIAERSSSINNPDLSPELSTTNSYPQQQSPNQTSLKTVENSSPRRRTRRRQRSNSPIWKDLSLDEKDPPNKRSRYARFNLDPHLTEELPLVSSDTVENSLETSLITERKTSQKRKTTGDINNEEHIVPKRKPYGRRRRRRKRSNKSLTLSLELTSSNTSISDIPVKDKSIDESAQSDSDASLRLKPNRLHTNYQSTEIPIQASSPFSFDSSTSAILEQFGTIIKKEAVIEEELLICVPPALSTDNPLESPCETLQDFLRAEEIKNKEFKLDCQRISYRLAKIQDCIGSISSVTT